MSHKINYLKPLRGQATKSFIWNSSDETWVQQSGYKAGKLFDGYSFAVDDIEGAYEVLKKYQNHPVFMIQGDFIDDKNKKGIVRRKRNDRGDGEQATIQDRELQLICFDIDGYDAGGGSALQNIELFITELPSPFWEADYIYQFSASFGLFSDNVKCHLFFWMEKAASNVDLREWIISYNLEKEWGNIIDPAVFVATQPIYTQTRLCSGADDPIKEFLGLVKKTGVLEWSPPKISTPAAKKGSRKESSSFYKMSEGIANIVSGKSFHDEINKLALSLMSRGLPADVIKETIRGMMQAARENISDAKRLQDWQTRFNDIDRSVDSCFDLVDNPSQEDLMIWLRAAPAEKVLKDFSGKTFKKSPVELKAIIKIVSERTGIDKRELSKRVKKFSESKKDQNQKQNRLKQKKYRQNKNIYEVVVNKHNYAEAAKRVAEIFKDSIQWPYVFVCGPSLVYIDFEKLITIRQMVKKSKMEKLGQKICRTPVIKVFRKPYHDLIARMGIDIRFVAQDLGKEILCPEKLATVVAMGNELEHRELTGIVQCPFIKENWEVFDENGYDSNTGLFSMIEKKLPNVFQHSDDAYAYLRNELLGEFPFKEELDAAVLIASMMALMQRPLLAQDGDGMPGFLVTSPVQSSGKTFLVKTVTTAVFKSSVVPSSFSSDEEELKKQILGLLREGNTCVFFDNMLEGSDIKSEILATAMTGDIFKGRLLGENRNIIVPSAAIWFFTGNNIGCGGDSATRIFPINLDPVVENPDTRIFKRPHLMEWVLENRENIIWALASIVRNGKDAQPLKTGSRFKLWDKYIRIPLHHACGIDVNNAILANKKNDQDFVSKKKLINQLHEGFSTGEIVTGFMGFNDSLFVSRQVVSSGYPNGLDNDPNPLGETLEEILGKYSKTTKSVGKLLSKMIARNYGGLILSREDTDRAWWQIKKISSEDSE